MLALDVRRQTEGDAGVACGGTARKRVDGVMHSKWTFAIAVVLTVVCTSEDVAAVTLKRADLASPTQRLVQPMRCTANRSRSKCRSLKLSNGSARCHKAPIAALISASALCPCPSMRNGRSDFAQELEQLGDGSCSVRHASDSRAHVKAESRPGCQGGWGEWSIFGITFFARHRARDSGDWEGE